MVELLSVAGQFGPQTDITDIRAFGNGNINDTFLVTLAGGGKNFILQRVNTRVFRRPELVMRNIGIATEHLLRRLELSPLTGGRRWEVPRICPALGGADHWSGPDGSFWRALSFVENSHSSDVIRDLNHAGEAGYALGVFHTLLSDLPPGSLADTLEGFHVTPLYLEHYDEVLPKHDGKDSAEVRYCLRFISRRRASAHILENARVKGKLAVRTVHGDPKVNNILIDNATRKAVGIVDLDTVKPGLVHYDVGDCLRSGCNPVGEETEDWESVHFETDLCRAVLHGYMPVARQFLTGHDLSYIYDSVRLIAFELGLRFFTDYLEDNVYFRVRGPEHNLIRALVQFRLTESIEAHEETVRRIVSGEL